MPPTIIAWDSFQARARPLPRLPRRARGSLEQPPKTSPNGANNDCPRLRCRRQPSDQPQDRQGAWPRSTADTARPRRRGDRMKRRDFITLIGGAGAGPRAAHAQQTDRIRRIGVVMGLAEDDPEARARLAGFRQGLEKRGWSEGRNISIDTRFAPNSSTDQPQVRARELIA